VVVLVIGLACRTNPDPPPAPAESASLEGERQPDVLYSPTPQPVVDEMLAMARVAPTDVVYDLGCGDGRIVVTAAQRHGARAIGFDIDPERVAEAEQNVHDSGVEHLVSIEQRDIFSLDLSRANVVTLYLLPELNVRLIPQLERMQPGSRVVSHDFDIEGVEPLRTVALRPNGTTEHTLYLFEVPLKKQP
jgi:SAM-dependent methyltransferase